MTNFRHIHSIITSDTIGWLFSTPEQRLDVTGNIANGENDYNVQSPKHKIPREFKDTDIG